MSQASDNINAWANEVNSINTTADLNAFEAKVMGHVNTMKSAAENKLSAYVALNTVNPVDPATTMAWAALQYAHAMSVISETTTEIASLTSAITNLNTAIANKASELAP